MNQVSTFTETDAFPGSDPKPVRLNLDAVRGQCPECGQNVISSAYYVKGQGYVIAWSCEDAEGCGYRRVV